MNMQKRFLTTRSSLCSLLILAALPRAMVGAQAPAVDSKAVSVSKVERKNRAPVSKDILQVRLPHPVETTLPNGLSLLIFEDHRFPNVTVALRLDGAGALAEPAGQAGLAEVTAQMLREGTKTRTSKQIGEEVDRMGAQLSASARFGSSAATIDASGLSDNFDDWFALLTDVLETPTFPADELGKLKTRVKSQLIQQRTQPHFLAGERFAKAVYGQHSAATVSATPESLDTLNSETLAKWHQERYAPQNAILAIAGDVNAKDLIPKLTKWLAAWQKTGRKVNDPGTPSPASARKIFVVDRPNSVQTTLAMGNIAIARTSPDYVPLVVLDQVLGAGPASRLFLNLREEKGYTYGVYSFFSATKFPGPWRAGGDLRTEVTEGAMTEFLKELNRIREEKVSEKELDEARHAVIAGFALSLEQPAHVLQLAVERKIYGFPADYWDTYPAKVAAVSADDVQRVAKQYIDPQTMQVVAVGDANKIKVVMEKFGPVSLYDAQGRADENKPAPK